MTLNTNHFNASLSGLLYLLSIKTCNRLFNKRLSIDINMPWISNFQIQHSLVKFSEQTFMSP